VRFDALTADSLKMAVFWVVGPCSMIEVHRNSEVLAASIIRAISVNGCSETSFRLHSAILQKRTIIRSKEVYLSDLEDVWTLLCLIFEKK
jgi:hypothetical protein